jgi:non-specific protein-tyrosine kinase
VELHSYLRIARRQRWLIILGLLLGLCLGAAAHVARTPIYEATTQVLLLPNDPLESVSDAQAFVDPTRYAAVQTSILTSREVLQQAAERLDASVGEVRSGIRIAPSENPEILLVTGSSGDPARAALLANTVVETWIQDRRDKEVASLQAAADEIEEQLQALGSRIADLRVALENDSLQAGSALEAANLQYTSLFAKQQDLLIESTLKKGAARVLEPAVPPGSPSGSSRPQSALLGGLLGLALGLGLGALRDNLDDRVRGRDEAEQITGLPVLAELPVDQQSARKAGFIAIHSDPLGAMAEATRALRTSISFLGVDEPVRRIVVTSAVPADGKTVVAANLAAAFAQAGVRTLIVSADLRRPRLEEVLQVEHARTGLSTLLASRERGLRAAPHAAGEEDAWDDTTPLVAADDVHATLRRTQVPGLSLLPAGPTPPNPAELLGSSRMDQLLAELDTLFELVILDTSPVLPVTDAVVLASKSLRVLLVTSMGQTRRRALERTVTTLRLGGSEPLGVVLNRVKLDRTLHSGYYGSDLSVLGAEAPRNTGQGEHVEGPPTPTSAAPVAQDDAAPGEEAPSWVRDGHPSTVFGAADPDGVLDEDTVEVPDGGTDDRHADEPQEPVALRPRPDPAAGVRPASARRRAARALRAPRAAWAEHDAGDGDGDPGEEDLPSPARRG